MVMEVCDELVGDAPDIAQDNERLLYTVKDKPNWFLSIFLGIQHFLTTLGAVISIIFILRKDLCILHNDPSLGYLISSTFMVSGISTLLQATLGVRLPIIQGPSFSFLICILSYLQLPEWNCPSDVDLYSMGTANRTAEWQDRMLEIQGAVISVSLIQILIGYTGLIGLLLRCVSPLTIAPTITLAGIALAETALPLVNDNWYLAFGTFCLVTIFSQLLKNVRTPVMCYTLSKGWCVSWIKGFQLFSILVPTVSVIIMYYITASFMESDDLIQEPPNRQSDAMKLSQWLTFPYPFQWGYPRFTWHSIITMSAALLVNIVNSVSEYYGCASICGQPATPISAVNRGIGIEGVGSLMAGIFGVGPGISSVTGGYGTIGITKVGNRRVIIFGAMTMILMSVFGKIGALFAIIPNAVLGSLVCIMASFVCSVGLSSLQHVNLKSFRNMFVFGMALLFGWTMPFVVKTPGFETGVSKLDQFLYVLLSTPFFLGFSLSLVLDNILPGTLRERGMAALQRNGSISSASIYDLPNYLKNIKKTGFYIAVTTCTR